MSKQGNGKAMASLGGREFLESQENTPFSLPPFSVKFDLCMLAHYQLLSWKKGE